MILGGDTPEERVRSESARTTLLPMQHESDSELDWVSASEVAEVAYCARAYRLMRVERVRLSDDVRQRLADGTRQHVAHGRRYAQQRALRVAAISLAVVAVALALVVALASG